MIERYATPEMTNIWNDINKICCWIKIEMTLLHNMAISTMHEIHNIPTVIGIGSSDNELFDIKGSDEIIQISIPNFINEWKIEEEETHHDVVAFINVLERKLNNECGRFLHYGITSSDLCDTEFALRISQSLRIVTFNVEKLREKLNELMDKHLHNPIMGRTHGMYAEPTSLGLIFGIYVSELDRHLERLKEIEKRICVGKISGCVGTYAHFNSDVERYVLNELQLGIPKITNQIIQRDRHAELFNLLALIAASLEKLAIQIRHLSRSEIKEMAEPFGSKQKGSSSMPHKRNPIKCENICGLARLMRGYAHSAMENIALWHERDISHSSVERFIAPDAFGVLNFMLIRMLKVIDGLNINTKTMLKRVEDNEHLWRSQYEMLNAISLGKSRRTAHDDTQNNQNINITKIDLIEYHLRYSRDIKKRVNDS